MIYRSKVATMTQMERVETAENYLASIWEEFLGGEVDESILQTAVYCQAQVNRIVWFLNERRNPKCGR